MTENEYLEDHKAHDWTYHYASGLAYKKGHGNNQHLKLLAEQSPDLESLRVAYSKLVWGEGEEPKVIEAAGPKASQYLTNKTKVMHQARSARKASKRYGYPAMQFLSCALKQAWAQAKSIVLCTIPPNRGQSCLYSLCLRDYRSQNQVTGPVSR